jgi:hypothetical protein
MRTKIIYGITLMTGIFLITSCNGLTDSMPTSTPDILLMDIYEGIISDFENLRNEIHDLAAVAADTPAEDLEPILLQLADRKVEIGRYEFPLELEIAKAQSALANYSATTILCYQREYLEYLREISGQESVGEQIDFCGQAQVLEETLDLYLQELKETYVEK